MRRILVSFLMMSFLCFQSLDLTAQCCSYTLSMLDSYGDGWNGATLEVLINKNSKGTYSAAGIGSKIEIQICNGDSLQLVYTGGMYEGENVYLLQDSSWNTIFQDGPDPKTGLVLTMVGDCNSNSLQGNHPCKALSLNTVDCILADNTGFERSGYKPNCAEYKGGDIWFIVEVPPSGNLSIETSGGSINDTGINAWRASSCSILQHLGCDDDGGEDNYSLLFLYDLIPNELIYIQVFGYGGAMGSFQLCTKDLGRISLDSSELPIVMINTLGQTINDEPKINALMDIKYNGPGKITYLTDSSNVYSGNIGIEIRGASSSGYPQRPYGFETRDAAGENKNVPILGMPAENDWVLLSNYNDRSLLKNLMAFKLFADMGNYSPRAQLCEVLIDSSYRGIYVIGEKIKRDRDRVDITSLNVIDTIGDELTGGYILQQNLRNNNNSFQSNYSPIDHPGLDVHFLYEYPDEFAIHPTQKKYIASFVDSLETALYSDYFSDPILGYRKYLNVPSFIDYFLVNEVARNADGFKKSVFYNKDKYSKKGGKLKAGPVWDFDWAWKNLGTGCFHYEGYSGAGWAHRNNDCPTDNYATGWYVRLFQDSTFSQEMRCTYEQYRLTMLDTISLFAYIDSMGLLLKNAQARHFKKWPILGISGPAPDFGTVATTYYGELDSLKSWISTRLQWLDKNIPGLCQISAINETGLPNTISIFPNPANDYMVVEYSIPSARNISYQILDFLGKEVSSGNQGIRNGGRHTFTLETSGLLKGIYLLKFVLGSDIITKKVMII